MVLDNAKNFAKVTVSLGYSAGATSVVLQTGDGVKLPTVAFNLVWWNSTDYNDPSDDPNVEIVRCTVIATDTLTITRAQEGTSATAKNISGKVYKMLAGLTAKVINTDIPAIAGAPSIKNITSGTIDDSNLTFGFDAQPTILFVNGQALVSGGGWSWTGSAVLLTSPVGSGGSIFAI